MTEPGAGSDTRNIKMTAVKDGNEWVLNGEKIFITGGNEADFAMVFAITDKERHAANGQGRSNLFYRRQGDGLEVGEHCHDGGMGPGFAHF